MGTVIFKIIFFSILSLFVLSACVQSDRDRNCYRKYGERACEQNQGGYGGFRGGGSGFGK